MIPSDLLYMRFLAGVELSWSSSVAVDAIAAAVAITVAVAVSKVIATCGTFDAHCLPHSNATHDKATK